MPVGNRSKVRTSNSRSMASRPCTGRAQWRLVTVPAA
jgi:hypothetical protein